MSETPTNVVNATPGDPEPVIRNDQAVIDVAMAATEGQDVTGTGVTAFVAPAGAGIALVDRDTDDHHRRAGDKPRRSVAGATTVRDESSLVLLVKRWSEWEDTGIVYADPVTRTVVAVCNDDWNGNGSDSGGELYGWRDRRIALALVHTPEWQRWAALDRKMMPQEAFAEHIEASAEDIRFPTAADMLEVAQTMKATIGVNFGSSVRLNNGQRQFTYTEDVQGVAGGRSGSMEVPDEFELALVPWQGRADAPFSVTARLRYRISPQGLTVGYVLKDVERILRVSFDQDVVAPIREAGLSVVHGTP